MATRYMKLNQNQKSIFTAAKLGANVQKNHFAITEIAGIVMVGLEPDLVYDELTGVTVVYREDTKETVIYDGLQYVCQIETQEQSFLLREFSSDGETLSTREVRLAEMAIAYP